jgi:inosine-uridine nucleoside N-ribohydrolase
MGGAVTVPGNRTPVAEFNVMSDPEAAEIVFRSGVPLTLVGLDVTYQAIFGHPELAELADRRPDPAVDFVHRVVRGYVDFYREHQGLEGAALHDPVAVAAVIQPDIIQTESWHIAAETQGKLTSGMVVADRRYRPAHEPNANIALELDYGAFRKLLMGHLGGANQNEKA